MAFVRDLVVSTRKRAEISSLGRPAARTAIGSTRQRCNTRRLDSGGLSRLDRPILRWHPPIADPTVILAGRFDHGSL
jgi:hypothetical protein